MKKKLEFSKWLVAGISLAFALGLAIGVISVLRDGQSLGELLMYIGAPFASVTALYLVKAKAENVRKIERSYETVVTCESEEEGE